MNSKSLIYAVFFTCLNITNVSAQDSSHHFSFLDPSLYFESIMLDPTECQVYGGVLKIWESGNENDGIYIPITIGFRQSFIRYTFNEHSGIEFGLGTGVFTQFSINKVEDNVYIGEIENADYKLSFLVNYHYKNVNIRSRLFHVSSHFSDDYMIRNQITTPNDGSLNYEQFDISGSLNIQSFRLYGGAGYVITPNAVRERISFQTGFLFRKENKWIKNIRNIGGIDMKVFEQNDFTPNIKAGIGFETGQTDKVHLGFMVEYYMGHLPYSTLEYRMIDWLGLSLFLQAPKVE